MVISLDHQYAPAYYRRGNIYRMLKQYDKAIAEYDQAISAFRLYIKYGNDPVWIKSKRPYPPAWRHAMNIIEHKKSRFVIDDKTGFRIRVIYMVEARRTPVHL
ncbi:tetratricopeptide repeat protein [Methylomusa anaerophila]|nr:tetratricopeptide repeat protein [Methylomusa anaerophila]